MFESLFQTFDDTADGRRSKARIDVLRADMKRLGIDGFLVPRADAHQNEYVPPSEERLAWLTGFTGSAGTAIVTHDRAAIFVDGRYTVQVRDQVDTKVITPLDSGTIAPTEWIRSTLKPGQKLGFDPWLHTAGGVERLRKAVEDAGAELVPVGENPIDIIWTDRPAPPFAQVVDQPAKFAGDSAAKKLEKVRAAIRNAKADALVLTDPHEIAWLFNIRGGDVAHTPLPLAWAVIAAEGRPALLIDGRKLSNALRDTLEDLADVGEPSELNSALGVLGGKRVLLDVNAAAEKLRVLLESGGASIVRHTSPISLLKAVKNAAEIRGTRAAHVRDGAAVVRFLAWFDRAAKTGKLDEIQAAEALESFRRETGALKDMREFYTRVLKGHIAVATAIFPQGTTGAQLDPFARRALWDIGADFDHGTGHGVGSYLSVHEGPHRISKLGHTALVPGVILSNEPGYYREGAFGIRIENLVLVQKADIKGAERKMLGFETLTLAPFDMRPVEKKLLTKGERDWLNAYHKRVLREIGPKLDAKTKVWLRKACAPI